MNDATGDVTPGGGGGPGVLSGAHGPTAATDTAVAGHDTKPVTRHVKPISERDDLELNGLPTVLSRIIIMQRVCTGELAAPLVTRLCSG